ncbi:hypothetical protein DL769_001469 [Monosporascus sp. CRB-8-3]|nr:hypothetical protein DL769_001469 [Monosporascus sp. CRB-8-3]
MGNDGGSIPKRRELVKEAARLPSASELKATALESLTHAWTTCPLSSEAMAAPTSTASDWRGRLYSYEAVLQCLAPSTDALPETQVDEFARTGIRGLRDVVRLRFCVRKDEAGREFRACPVSMKELGAATRAVYVVPCGHVFAEVAMRETIASGVGTGTSEREETKDKEKVGEKDGNDTVGKQLCPECSEPFQERDVIPILSTDEAEVERLARRMDELRALGLTHSLKKDNKSGGGKKKRKAGEAAKDKEEGANGEASGRKADKEKNSKDKNDISSRINNTMTASLTAKVLAEQEERNKRRKMVDGYKRSEAVR